MTDKQDHEWLVSKIAEMPEIEEPMPSAFLKLMVMDEYDRLHSKEVEPKGHLRVKILRNFSNDAEPDTTTKSFGRTLVASTLLAVALGVLSPTVYSEQPTNEVGVKVPTFNILDQLVTEVDMGVDWRKALRQNCELQLPVKSSTAVK